MTTDGGYGSRFALWPAWEWSTARPDAGNPLNIDFPYLVVREQWRLGAGSATNGESVSPKVGNGVDDAGEGRKQSNTERYDGP